jgi:hypothetical protein
MWQREKSYPTGSEGSSLASAAVISTVVFQDRSALFVKPRFLDRRWM